MEGNNVKSFENLCKIFEMRIKLDKEKNLNTPKEVFENYEKYAKKIDNIYNEEFQNELRPLISPAQDIEKEKDRLEKLISIVNKRMDKRTDLEERYYSTTGEYILSLQSIVSDRELEDKKERLANITRYIDNNNEINSIEKSITELNYSLNEEENKKEEYKEKNKIMEDDLYSEFTKIKNEDISYENINEENVEDEIDSIIPIVKEYKETLEVTKDSINSLIDNGINDDYNSYIEEANKAYYDVKSKELFLKIYKLVINIKEEFSDIFTKREELNNLLEERKELIKELKVTDINVLSKFEDMVFEQLKTIKNEEKVLDNISNYNSRIEFKKSRLEELKEDNESSEILSILKEYGLVETYDNEEFTESEIKEEIEENKIEVEEINPYRIKEVITAPNTLNIGLARLKGETIREKVNRKLNPSLKVENSPVEKAVEVSKKSEIPSWNINSIPATQNNMELPVWNINPIENNKIEETNTLENTNIPMWEMPNANNNIGNINLPQMPDNVTTMMPNNNVTPDTSNLEMPSINNNENINNDNMPTSFWVPLSEEKLENGTMPDINFTDNQNDSNVTN